MLAPGDPIAEFERAHRKRLVVFMAAYLGTSAFAIGSLVYFVFALPEAFPSWFIWYAAVVEPVVLGLLLVVIRRLFRRTSDFARAARSRLKAAGNIAISGLAFVFDNGLVLMSGTAGPQFVLYGSPSGVKAVPSIEDIKFLRKGACA